MLLCLSLNHRSSSLPLLETAARHVESVTDEFDSWGVGSVLLATCNRFELYLDGTHQLEQNPAKFTEAALRRLALALAIPLAELSPSVETASGSAAAGHLFAVASGLESAALGEEEISGQVRRAHSEARERQTVTDGLERLFQSATRTSRAVRERTGIRSAGQSLVRLALVLAERRIPRWEDASVLLVGTGAYAGATVAALRERGAKNIQVHSPSGRAYAFATSHDLSAVHPDHVADALAEADLVVACSAAQDPLLHPGDFAPGTPRPRLVLDLGMPRNIDPAVAQVPMIELLDLETISRHAPVPELSAEAEARSLVEDAAAEFATDQAERIIGPTLTHLRGHVLSILEDELCRAGRDGVVGGEVETALRHFTNRLLHVPTTRLRALAREGRADEARAAASALFGVES